MNKTTTVKKRLRYQQWIDEVKDYNLRPAGMSTRTWCEQRGVKPSTFYGHLRHVQEMFLEQNPSTKTIEDQLSENITMVSSNFVELPKPKVQNQSHGVAAITCGNARIEISEDISEAFLLKLIGAISHAQ